MIFHRQVNAAFPRHQMITFLKIIAIVKSGVTSFLREICASGKHGRC
jgi:hypothetical protein